MTAPSKSRQKFKSVSARDALAILDHERQVILILANDVLRGATLAREDLERVADAGRRILQLWELVK